MNTKNKRPFKSAQIEIVSLQMTDIIVTSPNPDPFPGEEDTFSISYRDWKSDRNAE